ncbi:MULTISPECIES: MFS transporter [unclassified Pseudomonas]|uniref:MFS transporter n=1 Tax=unclassified Pseudomonas TaxID=196821 RepID=UPI002B23B66F|nr:MULTISPECIES: MFS transporter [unclassified Pseudomonas]MEA9977665.1 MFS transporter [Pseudomonas sp. RTS4]MEB0199388.1 MFS transporter [Pseudomonas sp. 5S4]MEB0246528.1 MFS transporter [Pseudomonas sp. 10S5]
MNIPNIAGYGYLCGIRLSTSVTLWVDFVLIFTVLTFGFDASAETLGLAAALYGLPPLLLGPLFGALADRTSPFKFICWSFLTRCFVACLLFSATSQTVFLVFVFMKGLANLGSGSAEIILTRKLLSNEDLVKNISLVTIMDQFIKVCSPLAAGIIASVADKSSGFLVSAVFSLIGTICVIVLSITHSTSSVTQNPEMRSFGSLEAFKSFFKHGPITRLFFICTMVQSAVLGCYDSLLSLFLKNFGLESYAFGAVVSATAVGGILSGLIFPKIYPARLSLCSTLSLSLFGVAVILAGLLPTIPHLANIVVFMSLFLVAGIAYGLTALGFGITLQKYCPVSHLGVLSATARSLSLALMITTPILGAWLSRLITIGGVFCFAGVFAVIVGAWLYFEHRDQYHSEKIRMQSE